MTQQFKIKFTNEHGQGSRDSIVPLPVTLDDRRRKTALVVRARGACRCSRTGADSRCQWAIGHASASSSSE